MIRVTEAIGYFKTDWYTEWVMRVGTREANAVSKKALKIGTRIDEIIRSGDYVAKTKDTKEVKTCLKNFLGWHNRYNVQKITPLDRVEDLSIGLSGCPDFFWDDTGDLVDFKSSKRISPDYFFQLGGYKRLGFPAKRLGILICDKEIEGFQYVTNEDIGLSLETCIDAFEAVFKHYLYHTQIEAKLGEYNG